MSGRHASHDFHPVARSHRRVAENDVATAARTMLRCYGHRAARLMERRSQRYSAEGDVASAAFWRRVARAIRHLAH
jgi:hypothetical protein